MQIFMGGWSGVTVADSPGLWPPPLTSSNLRFQRGHEVVKKASSLTANGVPAAAGRSLFKGLAFLGTVPGKVTS